MTTDLETDAQGYTSMTVEQAGELLQIAVLFLQANGLKIGLSMLLVDADGMRTIGNLSPEFQRDAYLLLAERMDKPDDVQTVTSDGKLHATH